MRSGWRFHLMIILAYAVLALALTWPLAAHLGSHVPGDGADDPPLTWNLWWVRHALLDLGTDPFHSDYLFYPLGVNLAFYTLTLLNGLLSIPLQATAGLVPASNLLLLSSFVLSAYGTFLLAGYLLVGSGRRPPAAEDGATAPAHFAAFAAGFVVAFASSKMSYAALGQWNIASSHWIPFFVLYLFKLGDEPRRWRHALLAALFFLAQAYAELTYASFLVLFTAFWTGWQVLAAARRRRPVGRLVLSLCLLAVVCALGLLPLLAAMVPDLRAEGDFSVEGGGFADTFSADLLGFLVPTRLHPLLGGLVAHFRFDHTVGQHLYLGYAVAAVCLVGGIYWGRPRGKRPGEDRVPDLARQAYAGLVRFWAATAFLSWLLTLGPSLRVNGADTGLPLPFRLLAELPFFKANRYPSRYGVLLTLSLGLLFAFGLIALWHAGRPAIAGAARRPARAPSLRLMAGLLLVVAAFEHLSTPLPLSDLRVPPVYAAVAERVPGDATLLDLPVAWRNGFRVTGPLDPVIMFEQFYQTAHGKRLLAGNTSRNPRQKFQYFSEAPVISTLIALETGHPVEPAVLEQDRRLAPEVLRFLDVQAVVLQADKAGAAVRDYVETVLPTEQFYEGEGTVAYQVDLPPWPSTWTVEPGTALGRLSYAEGWGVPAAGLSWAQRPTVRLLVPLDGHGQEMAFTAHAPQAGQQVDIEVNGRRAAQVALDPGWGEYRVELDGGTVAEGLNEVRLRFSSTVPSRDVRVSPRTIGTTGVESPVNLVVYSAGQEVGDLGQVFVDGRQVAPNERGYNVVVIDPADGRVEAAVAFDTHLDEQAGRRMAEFLDAVPAGRVVAVAAADEASRLLGPEAVDALRGIGATGDLRDNFRWGQAIVGVKGASPGTALEAMDWIRPVVLAVGDGLTEPRAAAGFGPLTFTSLGK